IRLHFSQYLVRNGSHHIQVGPHDAKSDWPWRIGSENKTHGANASFRCESKSHLLPKTYDELVTLLFVRRENDHFGKAWIRKFWIIGKPEARSSSADIGADNFSFRLCTQIVLELQNCSLGGFDACALRQYNVNQDLRAVRSREELLLHESHAEN